MRVSRKRSVAPPVTATVVGVPPVPVLERPRRRRRKGLLALAVVAIVVGGLGTWWAVGRSAERVPVVGVARDVAWGQVVTAADVVRVEIVVDPALMPVPWAERDAVVGKVAATDLLAGTLVTRKGVAAQVIPGSNQAVVGVAVRSAQVPAGGVRPKDRVALVVGASSAAVAGGDVAVKPQTVVATVLTVGGVSADGSRTVDVVVAEADAARVAVASAGGRIAIVRLAGVGG